jgi:hypothetical protein
MFNADRRTSCFSSAAKMRALKVATCAFITTTVASLPAARAAQPWDEPFAKDTHAIIETARKVTVANNAGVIVLLDEQHYLVHRDGRTDNTIRRVYRIVQRDAVDDWSSVEQDYQPWYQTKPNLRARVIAADGSARWLDASTIADSPAREFDSSVFSDERIVRAPLPAGRRRGGCRI